MQIGHMETVGFASGRVYSVCRAVVLEKLNMALDIPTLPADAPTLELVTALEKCGAVIVKNFLTR